MENLILGRILEKAGNQDLINELTQKLSFSELNSLLLEVYQLKTGEITPPGLLNLYQANRFVKPSEEDPILLRQVELEILKIATGFSFVPIELSPLTVLGSCSVVATTNQNKVISALRGTEVVADGTNALALHICQLKSNRSYQETLEASGKIRYCTLHRHVRAQKFNNSRSAPHFKLLCMVTSSRDIGSYIFEKESLLEHLNVYNKIFRQLGYTGNIKLMIFKTGGYPDSEGFYRRLVDYIGENLNANTSVEESMSRADNQYYQGLQFKMYIHFEGNEREVADGGFVDWPQKLLGNKMERMLISGTGIGLLLKMAPLFAEV